MLFAVGHLLMVFLEMEPGMMSVEFDPLFTTLLRIFSLYSLHSVQTACGAMRMKSMSVASYNAAIKSISRVPDHWEAAFLIRQDMEESVCLLRLIFSDFLDVENTACIQNALHCFFSYISTPFFSHLSHPLSNSANGEKFFPLFKSPHSS